MFACFERFEIRMTLAQAESASHPGPCDDDVAQLLKDRRIVRQLEKIGHEKIRDELREYGAWDEDELANEDDCRERIVWIAAGDIVENSQAAKSGR